MAYYIATVKVQDENERGRITNTNEVYCVEAETVTEAEAKVVKEFEGYQYYNVTLEGDLNKQGELKKYIHFDFVYSSACPCSYELAEYARKYRNKATVSHSQRSVARISIEFDKMVWIEELQEMCDRALNTETQVVVKREDEMVFAELNGSYLKFV